MCKVVESICKVHRKRRNCMLSLLGANRYNLYPISRVQWHHFQGSASFSVRARTGTQARIGVFTMFSLPKANEFFYGNMEPTWITRREEELPYPFHRYMVPVAEFSVPQCCTRQCEAKIKNRLFNIPGIDQVIVDYHNQKVTVTGNVREDKILREIKKVKKRARLYVRKQYGQL